MSPKDLYCKSCSLQHLTPNKPAGMPDFGHAGWRVMQKVTVGYGGRKETFKILPDFIANLSCSHYFHAVQLSSSVNIFFIFIQEAKCNKIFYLIHNDFLQVWRVIIVSDEDSELVYSTYVKSLFQRLFAISFIAEVSLQHYFLSKFICHLLSFFPASWGWFPGSVISMLADPMLVSHTLCPPVHNLSTIYLTFLLFSTHEL